MVSLAAKLGGGLMAGAALILLPAAPAWPQSGQGGGVTVLKGKPAERAAPASAASARSGPANQVLVGSGGQHVWMVDPATGRVTDCQSLYTSSVGRRRISCVTRDLPPDLFPGGQE